MVPGVPRSTLKVPAEPLEAFLDCLTLREREGRDAGPHLAVQVHPRSPPARRCELVSQVVGEPKVGDLHAACPRCLPYQACYIFEGREGPMRLAPKLGEIILEPEPLSQARVEGEDHDGTPADDTPHLRKGGTRVGEVMQGE